MDKTESYSTALLGLFVLLAVSDAFAQGSQETFFSGRVLGPEGKPVHQAIVAAMPVSADWLGAANVRSDAKGCFRMSVKPGDYGLTATLPGLREAFRSNLHAVAGQEITNLSLRMGAGGCRISGKLTDGQGHLVKDGRLAFLRISNDDGDGFLPHIADGNFDITLSPGSYFRHAVAPGRLSRMERLELTGDCLEQLIVLVTEPTKAGPEAKDWIKANAIPLTTVEAGGGFEDLQPLKPIIGNARVVSLGEATHGTREFFQIKHRLLEYLVEQLGFTLFAIEANMPEARVVNNYVLNGKGDPVKALDWLHFWTWKTDEVLGMIRWMRRYNEDSSHPRKVKFYGFDMQTGIIAYRNVSNYLASVDPGSAAWLETNWVDMGLPSRSPVPLLTAQPTDRSRAAYAAATKLLVRFDERREAYVKAKGDEAFNWARQDARVLAQYAEMQSGTSPGFLVRDRCMAENVHWILEHEPGAKAVLWAHNAHVSSSPHGAIAGFPSMGLHLRKVLGQDIVSFGFVFRKGGFRAVNQRLAYQGPSGFEVDAHPQATLADALSSADWPVMVLDLRRLPGTGPVHEWFNRPQGAFDIGAMFNAQGQNDHIVYRSVTEEFDNLIFVERTSSSRNVNRP